MNAAFDAAIAFNDPASTIIIVMFTDIIIFAEQQSKRAAHAKRETLYKYLLKNTH